MDNVNYNFEIIEKLYKAKKDNNNDTLFNKPIILIIVSIIECILYDFIQRICGRTSDPLPNIKSTIERFFKTSSETDELKKIISRIKSQNLLSIESKDALYEDLDYLRKVRNRIHIQNKNHELNVNVETDLFKDEYNVYTEEALIKGQQCLLRIMDILCNKHPRWNNPPLSMNEFPQPWLD